ncbi:25292_t:CDS:1, partial [Racocetra persica]
KKMLLKDLNFVLDQLRIWVHSDEAKNAFEKTFILLELKTLIQAFQAKLLKIKGKKIVYVDFLFTYLLNGSEFSEETKKKDQIFG